MQLMKMNSKTTECYFLLETPAAGYSVKNWWQDCLMTTWALYFKAESVVLLTDHFLSYPTQFSPLQKLSPSAINKCNGLKTSRGKYATSPFLSALPFPPPDNLYIPSSNKPIFIILTSPKPGVTSEKSEKHPPHAHLALYT